MKKIRKLESINENTKIEIPVSKSYLNRALIISSLINNRVKLNNVSILCEDVIYMIDILLKIGINIEYNDKEKTLTIFGKDGKFSKPNENILNCGIGGTTTRFVVGLSVLFDFEIFITAEGKMLERPISDLIDVIKEIGINAEYIEKNGHLPIKISRSNNKINKKIKISGEKSSQFLTSILMISPVIGIESIEVSNLVSKSYIDITVEIMREFGITIENIDYKIFKIKFSKYQRNLDYFVESDWSSASYFLALEFIHNIKLNITGLNKNSIQGDRQFREIIKKISEHKNKDSELILDMSSMPDTSMTAMIICSLQNFNTKIIGLKTLKDKECDRLSAMSNEFLKIGIKTSISDDKDSITIYGNPDFNLNKTVEIETYNDHRIAMCFAILGTKIGNISIKNQNVVKKSFSNFWQLLDSLYE